MELYETVNRQQEWEQDQMNEIAKALVKAQKEFGPALKTSTNPHFRSRYADLSACVEAVIDALNNNGIMLTQRLHPSENGVTVETIFLHESGATMSAGMLNVPAGKQDPQGYGSALTYARRYSLMASWCSRYDCINLDIFRYLHGLINIEKLGILNGISIKSSKRPSSGCKLYLIHL